MDKSSELVFSGPKANLSNASGGHEYTKTASSSSVEQIQVAILLEELAEIIEAEGGVLIP